MRWVGVEDKEYGESIAFGGVIKSEVRGRYVVWVVGSVAQSWPPSHWASRPAGNEARTWHRALRRSAFRG